MTLTSEVNGYQWALPETFEVPKDKLRCRLDFYEDTTVLYLLDNGVITTRAVSARDVVMALLSEVPMRSGILPEGALFWGQAKEGVQVALWRPPKVWPVALQTEAFKPPRRFKLPMPGLIFVCSPGRPPRVYAARKRPENIKDAVYHAPLFNVFRNGTTCPGTHKYPMNISEIPDSFFASFFSPTADVAGRSKKHPANLLPLWEEIDGKERYPLKDLVLFGTMEDIMK